MANNWKEHKERSNPFALRLICWIALHLPRVFARLWLWPITMYFFTTAPKVRYYSRQYLRRVPGHNGSVLDVIRHIYHFSATILDRVYFLTDQFDVFDIKIRGEEHIDRILAEGQGAILLGAHVGSFEAMRCLAIERQHLPLKILMYHDHNAMITKILDELNPKVAASVINLAEPDALLKMKESLENGEFIGMLGDRVLKGEKNISAVLLGDCVNMSAGPFNLAAIMGVPVIGFFGIYKGGNRYKVIIKLLSQGEKSDRNKRASIVNKLTKKYAKDIEEMIRHDPYNWFNFYDYWGDEK